ncbi:MAG: AAA family ATPase, partial [Clostridia bacterium]|nr:AAA family ATPase [Clostridia bacterium]
MAENNNEKKFCFSSNFKKTVSGHYYVDKSLLIKDLVDSQVEVSLITRPRRFGKSLNMDMLKTFFEKTDEDTSVYFRDLKIWDCGEKYTSMQGKYPVIHLNFAIPKAKTWDDLYGSLKKTITNEYSRHETELDGFVPKRKAAVYERVANEEGTRADYVDALRLLTELLHKRFGIKPIVLIDEYDVPIQNGFEADCLTDAVDFMRGVFSTGLKDNLDLDFAVLTGVTRISQASIFTGLNNLEVYSVTDNKYSQYYGFTKDEVKAMLRDFDAEDKYGDVCDWYDGYYFGNTEIFNPRSVDSYIARGLEAGKYWANTTSFGELKIA